MRSEVNPERTIITFLSQIIDTNTILIIHNSKSYVIFMLKLIIVPLQIQRYVCIK